MGFSWCGTEVDIVDGMDDIIANASTELDDAELAASQREGPGTLIPWIIFQV